MDRAGRGQVKVSQGVEVRIIDNEDDYHQFMRILGEHLPVDFDFSRKVDIREIDYFDEYEEIDTVRIDTLLGDGFMIVDSAIRQRRLTAQYGDRIGVPTRAGMTPKM